MYNMEINMKRNCGIALLLAMGALVAGATNAAAQVPSGERLLGHTAIEPAYDDRTGHLIYLMTPSGARSAAHANPQAISPLYLIVYPNSAADAVGVMNCAHAGGDNCPDHGPGIAALAQSTVPAVYGNGVWGHDHIVDGRGGDEFNVDWGVVVVLFTNAPAARAHITTETQLDAAIDAGTVLTIETSITLHANVVSGATYARGTPVAPVQ